MASDFREGISNGHSVGVALVGVPVEVVGEKKASSRAQRQQSLVRPKSQLGPPRHSKSQNDGGS